jgi:putative tryptophan/tyrosine transport system substrate-binding protein
MMGALGCVVLFAATLPPATGAIPVVVEPGVDAYSAAVEGLREVLGPGAVRVIEIRPGADIGSALTASDAQLAVAVGARAYAEVRSRRPALSLVATMVLHNLGADACGRVELELPLASQLQAIRLLWPRRQRVAIIRNPAFSSLSAAALEAQARKEGFSAVVVGCDTPARLLAAVSEVKGRVDFLLCLPDPDLYNPVTIKPFVLATLESRLPVVAFSPAFVRAGAAAGIYPDYREMGRQTGEIVLSRLRGEACAAEHSPRKLQVAVNQRVTRLLGVDFQAGPLSVEVFR